MKKTEIEEKMQNMLKNGTFPSVLLISGERGIGKAFRVKNLLDNHKTAENEDIQIEFLSPRPKKNKKDQRIWLEDIIELRNRLNSTSAGSTKRFMIFEEAEDLRPESQNALLKILEEPGKNTFFILLVTTSTKLLQTVRSRAVELKMQNPSFADWPQDLKDFIESETNADLKEFYANHIGFVHRIVNEDHAILKEQIENAYKLISGDYPDRMGVAGVIAKSDWPEARLYIDLAAAFIKLNLGPDPENRARALNGIIAASNLINEYSNKSLAFQHLAITKL